MKYIIILILFALPHFLMAQVPTAGQLMQLHEVTTAERTSIVSPIEGSIIYDSDQEALFFYTSSNGWSLMRNEVNTFAGCFIISAAGIQTISGLPFKPSQITFTAHTNIKNYSVDGDNGLVPNTLNLQNAFGSMNGYARDDNGSTDQQVIYSGGSGTAINYISRYASDSYCIGLRYASQNGDDLGKILASLDSFDTNGFTLINTYVDGVINSPISNPIVDPQEIQNESVVVMFTAYR